MRERIIACWGSHMMPREREGGRGGERALDVLVKSKNPSEQEVIQKQKARFIYRTRRKLDLFQHHFVN